MSHEQQLGWKGQLSTLLTAGKAQESEWLLRVGEDAKP